MLFTLGHMNLAGVMVLPDRVFAGFVPEITAVQPPAASVLIEGQSVQDMAGFAAVTAAGNFTTNVADGGIALVEVLVLGDAVDVATPLFAGQSAGFSVTVRDTAGTERVFATALITVAPVPSAWAYTVEEQGVQITSWPAPGITPISILEVTENRALLGL